MTEPVLAALTCVCGTTPRVHQDPWHTDWFVVCDGCDAPNYVQRRDRAEAIEAWNERTAWNTKD